MKGTVALAAALILAGLSTGDAPPAASPKAAMDETPTIREPRVVVSKQARELALYDGPTLRKKFRIALASDAPGRKEREGDRRTPEGTFYVCTRNAGSRFHKFLGVSYPGPDDAARGLAAKRISKAEHDAIVEAHRTKSCPPWKTRLGGEVGIHGGGSGRDWTMGCVALENDAVDELWATLRLGDPIVIEP